MENIKVVIVAFLWVFFIMIFVANKEIRDYIITILDKNVFKTKLKIRNIVVIFMFLVVITCSTFLLRDARKRLNYLSVYYKSKYNDSNVIISSNQNIE